jgi:hypothetical protein
MPAAVRRLAEILGVPPELVRDPLPADATGLLAAVAETGNEA